MQQGGKLLVPQWLPAAKVPDELPQRSRTQALAGLGQARGQLGWQVRHSALATLGIRLTTFERQLGLQGIAVNMLSGRRERGVGAAARALFFR